MFGNHYEMRLLTIGMMVCFFSSQLQVDAHWWSVVRDDTIMDKLGQGIIAMCDHFQGLSRNQKALCKRYHSHMPSVREGAKNGITECQFQFGGHRWNCSTVNDRSVFGKVLKIGSKEIAFTYAVISAGVVHSVAKTCKTSAITECGCNTEPRPRALHPDWRWGGCGDNTVYAYGFAREFIDAMERDNLSPRGRKERARKAMNLHNNEVGRLAVVGKTRPTCRCHGVSGSCSLKTCWYHVPEFREIGEKLRQAHHDAVEMKMTKRGQIKPRKSGRAKQERNELIYIESSPDYCKRNTRTGVPGTRGRECKLDSTGDDSCGFLCCGRGHRTKRVEIIQKCNCKFQWCCTVRCDKCKKKVTKYICN